MKQYNEGWLRSSSDGEPGGSDPSLHEFAGRSPDRDRLARDPGRPKRRDREGRSGLGRYLPGGQGGFGFGHREPSERERPVDPYRSETAAASGTVGLPGDPLAAMVTMHDALMAAIRRIQPPRPPLMTVDLVRLRDVIDFFVTQRPSDVAVSSGFLLRERRPEGSFLYQGFLTPDRQLAIDRNGRACGRQCLARRIDDELFEQFGEHDLVVFT